MGMKYSKSTNAFYDTSLHKKIPADAVDVTDAQYATVRAAHAAGHVISADAEGAPITTARPDRTAAQTARALEKAVGAYLNNAAKALGYDSIESAVSYASEPAVPTFQAEGIALRAWRSTVWAATIAALAPIKAGTAPAPTAAAFITALPAFVAPTV